MLFFINNKTSLLIGNLVNPIYYIWLLQNSCQLYKLFNFYLIIIKNWKEIYNEVAKRLSIGWSTAVELLIIYSWLRIPKVWHELYYRIVTQHTWGPKHRWWKRKGVPLSKCAFSKPRPVTKSWLLLSRNSNLQNRGS